MRSLLFFLLLHLNLAAVEFVLFTQPKSGTHLLIPILTELSGKKQNRVPQHTNTAPFILKQYEEVSSNPDLFFYNINCTPWNREKMDLVWNSNLEQGTFIFLHAPYSQAMENYLEQKKCIIFFIRRDPRDQIVSLLNHYKNIRFIDKEAELLPTDEERLTFMIKKRSRVETIHFRNWVHSPLCCFLDFEKLMGSHGGKATDSEALEQMRKIATALELNLSDSSLEEVYQRHFGHGWNFFKGKVGTWRDYFTEEHKELVKNEIGDLLIELGYEEDYNW